MNLADIVDALVAAGGTAEQVAAVVRAAHAKDDERAEARRTKEREKKARQRAAAKAVPHVSPVVPGDSEGHEGTVGDTVSLKKSPPAPPKEITLPFEEKETGRAREVSTIVPAISTVIEFQAAGTTQPAIAVPTIEAEFDEFWRRYPHRTAKPEAFRAFVRARSGERVRGKPQRRPVTLAAILAGVDAYTRDKPPDHNWLNPSTFLNQERYFDEPAAVTGKRRMTTTDDLADMLAQARLDIEAEERAERDPRREIAYVHR